MKIISTFLTSLLLFTVGIVNSQMKTGTVTVGTGLNTITMAIAINGSTNTVSFTMTGPSTKYFGFGFNTSSMTSGSYTLLSNVSNSNTSEYTMAFHSAPVLQSTQNLSNVNSSISGTNKTFTFQRPLSTGDADDYVFSTSINSLNLIWAYGSGTTLNGHLGKGVATITFTDPCNIPITNLGTSMICQGDSVQVFGSFVSSAGDYFDTLTSIMGCDSVLKQTISVINIDTTITEVGNILSAVPGADSYQWYDCSTNQPIANANGATFSATATGSYFVEITKGSCVSKSDCHNVIIDGIDKNDFLSISVYPNPVRDILYLNNIIFDKLEVFEISGKQVRIDFSGNSIDVSKFNNGVYTFKIYHKNQLVKHGRFVKM